MSSFTLPLSVLAYLKDFQRVKSYYEDLIKELEVTLDTQSEVKQADINVLEEKLSSTIKKFEIVISNSNDSEKELFVSHVGQVRAILDKFQSISAEVNQQIESSQNHDSAKEAAVAAKNVRET